jgi:hypothetical protein
MASGFVADLFRSRDELLAENALLRQQLIVASRKVKQPKFRPLERGLVVALSSVVKSWQSAIVLVKPDTVLRWHREGFRWLWKRKAKATKPRQPRISADPVNTREVLHVAMTREPSQRWTAQQLRQLTPFDEGHKFTIRDRDDKFGAEFDRVATGAGIRVLKTAVQAPLMNATCERFLGSVRRKCLDHVLILGEDHLRSVLGEYVEHFNGARPHQGIEQRLPAPTGGPSYADRGKVVAIPVLGGLHHDYRRAA